MITRLYLAHQAEGRSRLRLAGLPADTGVETRADALAELVRAIPTVLSDPHGLLRVDARPLTGSLVIEHPGIAGDAILAAFAALPCEIVEPPDIPFRPSLAPLIDGLRSVDSGLRSLSADAADLRTALFVVLTGMAVAQLLRGQVMAPASSLLWYALDLVLHRDASALDDRANAQ